MCPKNTFNQSHKKRKFLVFFSAFVLMVLSVPAKDTLDPLIPYKTDIPPVLDGNLDDPVWQKAPHETGFKTYHPDYGIDMVENSIVYYAYDRENLYFAFRCFDSQPNKVKASISRRDNIHADDWICINLDSFNDHQSLYALYVNPLGIQGDSRFEGGAEDFSVDIVWYSSGKIDDKGYAIELKIPLKSIRFTHKDPVEMGVIFERKISRRSEAGTYPPLDPVQGPNFLTQTRPIIFHDIKHYSLFEVLPAFTYSQSRLIDAGDLASSGSNRDISLTAKYGITSHLIFDGTVNPDFSQVEADAGQVDFNLRYALFFPETRPFFLEGLEKFNFGGYNSGDPLSEVVHTRAIIDPLVGLKLSGRIGKKNTVASIYALDDLPDTETDNRALFGIFRYKRTLAQDGFLGLFYTGRERESGYNRVLGVDGQVRLNKSTLFGYHFFGSQTKLDETATRDDGHALGLDYYYLTRNWIINLGFQDIGEDFWTETGYITRTGLTRFRSGLLRMFYPKSKFVRRIDPMFHSIQIRDRFSGLYETFNSLDMRLLFPRNSFILFGGRYATEVFQGEKFNISAARLTGSSQLTKQLFFHLNYTYGKKIRYVADPYQGSGNSASANVIYQPTEKLNLALSLTYTDFYRDSDSVKEYDYTIIRSRNTYQVNKYLFFRGIIEYNSFRKTLLTDFLASFTYIPGTVIHVGYGSFYERIQWTGSDYVPADRYLETQRGFFFKASFLWRI
jgi:hypothetical protein